MGRLGMPVLAVCLAAITYAAAGAAEEPPDAESAALVRQLGAEDMQAREAAEKKLLELGNRAAAAVRAGLESPDLEIRTRCERIMPRLAWAGAGKPPPFDTLVPASTVLYVGAPDTQGLWRRFKNSHVGTLANHDALSPFWNALADDLGRREEGRLIKRIFTDYLPKADGQAMLALTHLGGAQKDSLSVLFVSQHPEAEAMLREIEKSMFGPDAAKSSQRLEGAGPFRLEDDRLDESGQASVSGIGVVANALMLFGSEHLGTGPAREFLRRWRDRASGGGLAAQTEYAAYRKRFPKADLFAYLNGEKLLAGIESLEESALMASDRVVRDVSGLDCLRSGFAALSFREDGLAEEHIALRMQGERRGLMGLFALKPLAASSHGLHLAPRDAAAAVTARFDLRHVYRQVVAVANRVQPKQDAGKEWNALVQGMVGVVVEAILAMMDGELTLIVTLDDRSEIPRGVLAIRTAKPAELLAILKRIPAQLGAGEWKSEPEGGVELLRLTGPALDAQQDKFQICAAALKEHVIVGSHLAACKSVLALRAGAGGSVAENEAFKALRAELPAQCGAIGAYDAQRIMTWGLAQIKTHAGELGIDEDMQKRMAALPPAAELTRGWKPWVFGVASDEGGITWKGVGSMPMLDLNLTQVFGMMPMMMFYMRSLEIVPVPVVNPPAAPPPMPEPVPAPPEPALPK